MEKDIFYTGNDGVFARTPQLAGSRPTMVALWVALALGLLYYFPNTPDHGSDSGDAVRSGLGSEIIVVRTSGGLLEVSTIRAEEHFDKRIAYSILGIGIGETIPHIRVPAIYRYHIELAREWQIHRDERVFTVVAPTFKPSLPVAVDLSEMEKDVGGSWVLVAFNAAEDLNTLERQITAKLAGKAASPVYLQIQREHARRTVTEFVTKWLITQSQWKDASKFKVNVRFADE